MATIETIRQLTIRSNAQGVRETTEQLKGLADAQKEAGAAAEQMAVVTDRASRKQLSALNAYERLNRQIDASAKAMAQYERGLGVIDFALSQKVITIDQYNRALEGLQRRYQEAGRPVGAFDQSGVNALSGIIKAQEGAAKESVKAFDDAAREAEQLQARVRALQTQIDPAAVAWDRYNSALKEADDLLKRGAISAEQHSAAVLAARTELQDASKKPALVVDQSALNNILGVSADPEGAVAKESAQGIAEAEREMARAASDAEREMARAASEAEREMARAASEAEALQGRVRALENQVDPAAAAWARYNAAIAEADDLLKRGLITQDLHAKAMAAARQDLQDASKKPALVVDQSALNNILGVSADPRGAVAKESAQGIAEAEREAAQAASQAARAQEEFAAEVSRMAGALDPYEAAQERLNQSLVKYAQLEEQGLIAEQDRLRASSLAIQMFDRTSVAVQRTASGAGVAAYQIANMQYQLNDIATGLISGQSPFVVFMQQGLQLTQMLSFGGKATTLGGAIKELGEGILGFLTSPLNLAVIGLAAAAGAVTFLITAIKSGVPSTEDLLKRHAELVTKIKDSWIAAKDAAARYGGDSANILAFQQGQNQSALLKKLNEGVQGQLLAGLQWTTGPQGEVIGQPSLEARYQPFQAALDALNKSFQEGRPNIDAFRDAVAKAGLAATDPKVKKLAESILNNEDLKKLFDALNPSQFGEGIKALRAAYQDLAKQSQFASSVAQAPKEYQSLLLNLAQQYQNKFDPNYVASLINHESAGWNPNAVSPVGAVGLGQFMPGTAKDMGLLNRNDPIASIQAVFRYLQTISQIANTTDPRLLTIGYHNGPDWLKNWLAKGSPSSALGPEMIQELRGVFEQAPSVQKLTEAQKQLDASVQKSTDSLSEQRAALQQSQVEQNASTIANQMYAAAVDRGEKNIDKARIAVLALAEAMRQQQEAALSLQQQSRFDFSQIGLTSSEQSINATLYASKQLDANFQPVNPMAAQTKAGMELIAVYKQIDDTARTAFEGIASSILHGTSALDAMKNALGQVADKLLQMAIDQLWAAAFGGKGGIGGFFGSLFGGGTAAPGAPLSLAPPTAGDIMNPANGNVAGGTLAASLASLREYHAAAARNARDMNGGDVQVNVISNHPDGATVQSQSTRQGPNGQIVDLVVGPMRDAVAKGKMDGVLGKRYPVAPRTVRR